MRERAPFLHIGVEEAETLLRRSETLVLDVRDAGSFAQTRIDGACNVAYADLASVIGAVEKTRSILIYCYHGVASQEYAQVFSDFGFREVYSLDGGYETWAARA